MIDVIYVTLWHGNCAIPVCTYGSVEKFSYDLEEPRISKNEQ